MKRKRLTQACDCCRKMKVRCDATKPSCSTCYRLNIPCTFLTRNKRRGPRQNMMDAFGFLSGVSGNFQQTVLKMDGGKIIEVTSSMAAEEGNEVEALLQKEQPSQSTSKGAMEEDSKSDSEHDVLNCHNIDTPRSVPSDIMEVSSPQTSKQSPDPSKLFAGKSPAPSLADTARETFSYEGHLVETYFNYIHIHAPIIHKATFMEKYREEKVDSILISSICALALRYQPQNSEDPLDSIYSKRFENEILSRCESASIEVIQSLLLMSIYEISYGRQNRSCVYIGIATRLCQMMKIHRMDEFPEPFEKYSVPKWIELETKRRSWWYCCVLDQILSAEGKHPVGINIMDCSVSLPVNTANWEDGIPTQNQILKLNEGLPALNAEDGAQLSSFSALAILAIIVGRVNKYYVERHFLASDERHKEFVKLNDAIQTWETILPQRLRHVPMQDSPKSNLYLFNSFMFSMKQAITIRLNFTRLRIPGQEWSYDVKSPYFTQALKNAFVAAKCILSVVQEIKDQPVIQIHPFFGFSVFSAATFYLHGAKSKNSEQSQRSFLCLTFLVKVLRHLNSFWKNCGNYCSFLLETLRLLKEDVTPVEFTKIGMESPAKGLTFSSPVLAQSSSIQPHSHHPQSTSQATLVVPQEKNIDELITEVIVQQQCGSTPHNQSAQQDKH
ncbi:hypothetical protein K493DRAFT_371294 [Basidiobolus meristosporus CBS 931.73]|uniref:Zn(2)-C6 fungal-type domain-containing protein n=1 Tax=Basidiobolus meristosporus CBS 931.73 TaxID=1314790 RepID=A0A1Y1Z871_9FUNG|nr:hypothetical protein K493DRAFT_371294 [Basidiobolus meristosporus CBS 931.73]|eukprot:ORY06460.1 hypothetical protein K493DRAFT_371294 [Basidiobolus meristosporus CBS 931.73]